MRRLDTHELQVVAPKTAAHVHTIQTMPPVISASSLRDALLGLFVAQGLLGWELNL